MDIAGFLKDYGTLVFGGGGWAAYVKAWYDGRAARARATVEAQTSRTSLLQVAQDAVSSMIQSLRERLEDIEGELASLRKEYADMQQAKDARITLLEGEKRQLEMQINAYRNILRRNNIPEPVVSTPYYEAHDGQLEAIGAPLP